MNFWRYIKGNDSNNNMNSWEYTKRIIVIIFFFFAVPIFAYLFIKWDPVIWAEDRTPIFYFPFGFWLVIVAYWFSLFFIHKYQTEAKDRRRQLKRMLDDIMNKTEKTRLKEELRNEAYFEDDEEIERLGYQEEAERLKYQ